MYMYKYIYCFSHNYIYTCTLYSNTSYFLFLLLVNCIRLITYMLHISNSEYKIIQ
jgi:hypothetical protein